MVTPICPGSWLVETAQLTRRHTLEALLRKEFEDLDPENLWDEVTPLEGGYVLRRDEILLEPSCCGTLENLDSWRDACESQDPDWQMVWIGHPWTYVRSLGDRLSFHEPTEDSFPSPNGEEFSVGRDELERAVRVAEKEVEALAVRLTPVVEQLTSGSSVERIVEMLTLGRQP